MFAPAKIALIAASATLFAGAASAEEFQSNGRTVEVLHGDLNLAKPDHQRELRQRISRAANRVCATPDLTMMMACRAKTLANVDAPVAAAIARADSRERYADAGREIRTLSGN